MAKKKVLAQVVLDITSEEVVKNIRLGEEVTLTGKICVMAVGENITDDLQKFVLIPSLLVG